MTEKNYSIPSFHEQSKISNFLNQIDELIYLHNCKLEKLSKLKIAFSQKMFPYSNKLIPLIRFSGFSDRWNKNFHEKMLNKRNLLLKEGEYFIGTGIIASSIAEQNKIIDFFKNLEEQLEMQSSRIEYLKQLKLVYMQKMLI